ncbi:MAG: succinylglutamate desuccinylase/aspartoacylase family protein [Bacteroidota bacterium]
MRGEVSGNTLVQDIPAQRIIGKITGRKTDPVVIFLAGIHGNEPSGIVALQEVFKQLQAQKDTLKGSVYALSGNLPALSKGVRFIAEDLNRIWTVQKLKKITSHTADELSIEEKEAQALYNIILELLSVYSGPFYFIDFHTTSSKTVPFITISDSLINRKFSALFPVPTVLGIEEYLEGALLSYTNQLGYVALAFESGQHQAKEALSNTISFIYLTLVYCGCLQKEAVTDFQGHKDTLSTSAGGKHNIYEVTSRYRVGTGENFKMLPGFKSFQPISKGTLLAKSNENPIKAHKNTVLFMPLYQNQGTEGFFTIKKIPPFFLKLSVWLRASRTDALLACLPGVSWETAEKGTLLVNLKIARFLTKPLFHLLGYRSWKISRNHVRMINRERRAKTKAYKKEAWYRSKRL